jgi:hypothetical protein
MRLNRPVDYEDQLQWDSTDCTFSMTVFDNGFVIVYNSKKPTKVLDLNGVSGLSFIRRLGGN